MTLDITINEGTRLVIKEIVREVVKEVDQHTKETCLLFGYLKTKDRILYYSSLELIKIALKRKSSLYVKLKNYKEEN